MSIVELLISNWNNGLTLISAAASLSLVFFKYKEYASKKGGLEDVEVNYAYFGSNFRIEFDLKNTSEEPVYIMGVTGYSERIAELGGGVSDEKTLHFTNKDDISDGFDRVTLSGKERDTVRFTADNYYQNLGREETVPVEIHLDTSKGEVVKDVEFGRYH